MENKSNIEKIDLSCPKCKGTMEFNEEENELTCPFCRHKIILQKGESIEELIEKERKLGYARVEGEKLAEEKAEKRKKNKKIRNILIAICVFGVLLTIAGIYKSIVTKMIIKEIGDPFEYVQVNCNGVDGKGTLEIKIDDKMKNIMEYKASKEKELSNGEKITLTAKSSEYDFVKKEKVIEVQGLSTYLTSFDELTDEMKEFIHKQSYDFLKNKITNGITFYGELQEIKQYKMYLHTDGNTNNVLYDVYSAKIKAKDDIVYDKYVIAGYRNVILTNKENDLLRYEKLNDVGKIIYAGDPKGFMAKGYSGNMTGFYNINELEEYLRNNENVNMKLITE